MDTELAKLIITGIITPTIALVAKYLYDKSSKDVAEKEDKEFIIISLTRHPFFERMKCLRTHIQYSFELPNKGKQEVFKDILINKFNIVIETYWKMVQEIDKNKDEMNEVDLYNLLVDNVREGLKTHDLYFRNSAYTSQEQQCLEVVMQKFNKWNAPRTESMFQSIQNVCTSRFYNGIIVKSSVVLDILQGTLVDTINDAELTLNELNGDLRGLTFKGIDL